MLQCSDSVMAREEMTVLKLSQVHRVLCTLLVVLRLPLINDPQSLLGSLDTAQSHGTESGAHAIRSINFTQLHATHDQSLDNLPGTLHNCVLGGAHVQPSHTTELLELLHADETLDAESTEGAIVASCGDDKRRVDRVRVHAGLVIVVHGDEGPVGDHTSDAERIGIGGSRIGARDEILNRSGVEELDVGEREDLREERRSEERLDSQYGF
jgi:hypothetical protein